jgi:hypothetical protein
MSTPELGALGAEDVAGAMLGTPVAVQQVVGGGRNSRIWRANASGRLFALKQYPSRRDDPRDRLATEVAALRLMNEAGIDSIPRVIAVDEVRGYALFSWIEGVLVTTASEQDIDAAAGFLQAVHGCRLAPGAEKQPLASEACLSADEVQRQVAMRLQSLAGLPAEERPCRRFLAEDFTPAFDRLTQEARVHFAAAGLDFAAELPQERRSLVPSDFGFHNSLRRGDGSLAFVDFEYFGWDDPVKLTADVLLHPGSPLPPAQHRRFRDAAERIYGDDPSFGTRLKALLPLFALRWVLILLNEFLPDRWQRRVLAGVSEDWTEAKVRQLTKARAMLMRANEMKD